MGWLKKAVCIGALAYATLTCQNAYSQTNTLPPSEQRIARHLEAVCADGKEHTIYYLPKYAKIEDLTEESDKNWAIINDFKARLLLTTSPPVIAAHCHNVNKETIKTMLEQEEPDKKKLSEQKKALKLIPQDLFEQRTTPELPSAWLYQEKLAGDMATAITSELIAYIYNPQAVIEHRIVAIYENKPSKIIQYGLTAQVQKKLRDLASQSDPSHFIGHMGNWMIISDRPFKENKAAIDYAQSLTIEYIATVKTATADTCDIWELDACKEPNLHNILAQINASGKFYVKELGTVPKRK